MNYNIKTFHDNLIELINNCGLPIGTAYFVVKDCLSQLEIGYKIAANKEASNGIKEESEEIPLNNTPDK